MQMVGGGGLLILYGDNISTTLVRTVAGNLRQYELYFS